MMTRSASFRPVEGSDFSAISDTPRQKRGLAYETEIGSLQITRIEDAGKQKGTIHIPDNDGWIRFK